MTPSEAADKFFDDRAVPAGSVSSVLAWCMVAVALGPEGKAKGKIGCWLTLAEWEKTNAWHRINVKTVKVDGKKIKSDTFYRLKGGKFVEAYD